MASTATPTPTGAEQSAAMWREQRIAQATAPSRIKGHIEVALDHVKQMDEQDSDVAQLGYALVHCTKAIVIALDARA